jgi:geranylgeranyl pyrophosphate synthase
LVAPDEQTGKPRWADIRNGKQTLPLIYTLEKASDEDKQLLVRLWNNGRDPGQIMPLIEKYGGVDYALDEARKYAVAAQEQIADLPRTRPVELLRQIAEYVVNRSA